MKLRRVLFSLIVIAIAFVLFACGGGGKVKITFDSNGGSEVAEISAKAGEEITKPADPTKENLTFGGWYSDIDLTEAYDFPKTMPEESVELYAKWVVTLTFDTQGGPAVNPIVADGGKAIVMPADPVRDGYVFVGWFTDKTYSTAFTYVMPRVNTTVYAKWQVFEVGSAITVPQNFSDNDGVFLTEQTATGVKITATAAKGEWSYVSSVIPCGSKNNNTVVVDLVGTKGVNVTLKVEGGNAEGATETTAEMTGELQRVIWTDESTKFSSIGGAKFLIFLNGGTMGCGETPEYVEIRSIKLYRTLDAEATQKAAIYFVMNGAQELPEIYDVPGAALTAPADPERSGYEFGGWFADSDFTTPFVFDKMPENGAMVFAKWNKLEALRPDVDILGEPVIDNPATYEASFVDGVLKFKKTAAGEAWSWIGLEFPRNVDLGGYDHLVVVLKGTKDEQVLLKINDSVEKWVTCTGTTQVLEFEFDHVFDMSKKAMIIFAKPNVEGESGEFEISDLYYANHKSIYSLMDAELSVGEDCPTVIEKKDDGTISLKKAPKDGTEWDCALLKVEEDLTQCNLLVMSFKGTAGEQLLIKIFDAQEKWVNLTGELQTEVIEITANYDPNKAALVLFANPNANGTGNEIIIYNALFVATVEGSDDPIVPGGKVEYDFIQPAVSKDDGHYEVSYDDDDDMITLKKTAQGGEWSCAYIDYPAGVTDMSGINHLVVAFTGTEGEPVLFKINDSVEKWVTCTGEYQLLDFDFNLEFDMSKKPLFIFANAGVAGASGELEIEALIFANHQVLFNLMNGTLDAAPDGPTTIEKKDDGTISLKKAPKEGSEWDCAKITLDEDLSGCTLLNITFKGTAGEQLLIKVFDSQEKWVDLTGVEQTEIIVITANYDPNKYSLVLFANPNANGTGNEIIISEIIMFDLPL